ncbi:MULTISPECIES: hypothetical protein [Acetobacter]|uniref:Uncharacterized protein n=2 Tax=Acetobacter TaxID=434 RepID=A0AAN1PJG4_9PROT|nr:MULTISPECIES: hypothetical protein [Acetobacter]ASL39286.1 hypothetical protein CBI36_01725 [Acetobacter oryzifermentans]AXN01413.1 hypothetical protein CJF59_13290 [Acetobacter pomorum]KAA8397195.1 hypothetical protein FKW22_05350 [Acetobacter sp. DmW_125124]KAA8397741.1 hypothetical protein FKW20_08780 [Acetobacter sp. DmW_125127]KAA8401144.1 hypothetical protein FKW19_00595 [Acetobacter sp. DmW_125128]
MSDQKPTGVFIRLPLSREDERKIHDLEPYKKGKERALLAIGTPVADDELKPIAYVNAERLKWKIATDNDFILSFSGAPNLGKGTLKLADGIVFYTDHQAALAQRDAEIARFREYYEASEAINQVGILGATPEMYDRENLARKALKGPDA